MHTHTHTHTRIKLNPRFLIFNSVHFGYDVFRDMQPNPSKWFFNVENSHLTYLLNGLEWIPFFHISLSRSLLLPPPFPTLSFSLSLCLIFLQLFPHIFFLSLRFLPLFLLVPLTHDKILIQTWTSPYTYIELLNSKRESWT